MPLIIAVFLGLSALVVVCYPLLGLVTTTDAFEVADPLAEVADRETQAKRALREVDFDHRLGNLEDVDYESLRDRYEQRALEALRERYAREQELDLRIDRELATLRAGQATSGGTRIRARDTGSQPAKIPTTGRTNGRRPANEPHTRRRRSV
jgi:hypothetical protein